MYEREQVLDRATVVEPSRNGERDPRSTPFRREDGWIVAFGPASLSNLGPGFDAIGLCIEGIGDYVSVLRESEPGVRLESVTGDEGRLPLDPERNTACVAAAAVLERLGVTEGVRMRIEKRVPFGSGIGGSSASAVAGAWAANAAFGEPLAKEDLVEAVLRGEEVASGGRHGDNVLPALFGGLVLVSSSDPARYRRVALGGPLHLAIVVPEVTILTRVAREMLPRAVPLRDAVHNAAELAFLVDAFRCGDYEAVGAGIMADRLVEPVRATLVPCYQAVRAAARAAGAYGCALTGSGPAMFALAPDEAYARRVQEAMQQGCRSHGIGSIGLVTQANCEGVRVVS